MQLPQDFKEFIGLMISANVRFVMIGGYAYNLYRNPRATGDIDFFVAISSENETGVRRVLVEFGFGSALPDESQTLLVDGKVLMLGRSPFRIDILTKIDGVTYDEVEASCQKIRIDELWVPVISPQMLLRNKEASGRPKDLLDFRNTGHASKHRIHPRQIQRSKRRDADHERGVYSRCRWI